MSDLDRYIEERDEREPGFRQMVAQAEARAAKRAEPTLVELTVAAKAARKPLPPEDLVDAQHDRVHHDLGRSRAARTVKIKRRGTD